MVDNVISELLNNFSENISKDYSQEFSVICLSENNCINPMWGNYADKYRGICLEYNLKDTKEKYFRDFCFPIKYVKREADFEQIKSNESFVLNNIPFEPLLKKSFDWNYEEEWRIIIHKPSLKEIINETKIDDKIKEHLKFIQPTKVYLGLNIYDKYKNQILKICKEKGIDVYRMEIDNTDYNFKYVKC